MSIYIKERPALDLKAVEELNAIFWKQAIVSNEHLCWEWQGKITDSGYGYFNAEKTIQEVKASHIAYVLHNKKRPVNFVLHSCNNPPCINPHHLRDGTHLENVKDRMKAFRLQKQKNQADELTQLKAKLKYLTCKYGEELSALEMAIKTLEVKHANVITKEVED